jgi:hypothetical protein
MKKNLAIKMTASFCFFISALIASYPRDSSLMVKEAAKLSQEELMHIFEGKTPDVMIHFPEGEKFSLQPYFISDFFTLEKEESPAYSISIKKDFFIRVPAKGIFLLSLDGQQWKTFEEIVTGTFHVGLGRDSTDYPFISIGGELYERKKEE